MGTLDSFGNFPIYYWSIIDKNLHGYCSSERKDAAGV